MTTPTDTHPSAWAEWKAKALELADAIASAQVNDDRDHGLVAARAALAAHLDEVPMGEPVGYVASGALDFLAKCGPNGYTSTPIHKNLLEASVPLYLHPKELA